MKFSDISPAYTIRIKSLNAQEALPTGDVLSIKMTCRRGEFELTTKDIVADFTPISAADINRLTNLLSAGQTTLAQLSTPAPDGSVDLNILVFFGEQLEMGNLEIGLDETAAKRTNTKNLETAIQRLQEQCVLEHGGETYFFIAAGASSKIYLEPEEKSGPQTENTANTGEEEENPSVDEIEDESSEVEEPPSFVEAENESANRNFAILGIDYRFALTEKAKGNGQTIFLASKITRVWNRREYPAIRLAHGNLLFKDWTAAGELGDLARRQLRRLEQDGSSYLKKWDEFSNIEEEIFRDRVRKVGIIPFTVKEENKEATVLQCAPFTEAQKSILPEIDELAVVDDDAIPDFLNNPAITFANHFDEIANRADAETISRKKSTTKNSREILVRVKEINLGRGELRVTVGKNGESISGTKLIYPVAGEIAQNMRRNQARNKILTNRAVNPNLGLLIEENGSPLPSLPPPKMKALTAFVKRKIFPHNAPNDKQIEAISIALNTPDIALIQGPPGTGKTTVIAAIVERLNEEADKREGIRGRVLLTGFQHDAVKNIINHLKINGLPVPKFGQRSGDEEEADFSSFQNELRKWCQARTAELRKKNPQLAESELEKRLRGQCVQYIENPSLPLAILLLEDALNLPDRILEVDLRNRLQAELKHLRVEQSAVSPENPNLSIVRNLRVTEAGFSDDGPERAGELRFALNDELEEKDRDILVQAERWRDRQEKPPFLKALQDLKRKLLEQYTPPPVFRVEKARDSVINLINETIDRIRLNGSSVHDRKTAALAELLMSMENDPEGIMNAVTDYSFAFAATCQQSVNATMQKVKGLVPGREMEYDYVIVDEAARVSPRDLMIPMVQGKHIILVGDHRQLPQLIDDEVARRMENGTESSDEKEWLKKSMFEYLFTERVPALEKRDGIKRRVTLNQQYRTHPILGDFISRNFYERFAEEEKFNSGATPEYFIHTLPGVAGKCAVWLNIPQSEGGMNRNGNSIMRISEVRAICNKLREWIEYDDKNHTDGTEKLSFGVISFYKAQSDRLREMVREKLGDLAERYSNEGRLRIGTVDSFQGMEFDVVFLSLVRTGKSGFGFLRVPNRLNVSMSRQKKLLVAVGDAAFYDTDQAREQVPGLADFLNICRTQGRVL